MKFKKNSCLLLIDLQTDYQFLYDRLQENVTKLLKKARKENITICFVFKKDNSLSYFKPFSQELRGKRQLDKGIPFDFAMPLKHEHVIIKHGYDSFFETNLDKFLTRNRIETLYIAGCLTGICVLNTIFSGFNRGYRIHMIENTCSDRSKKRHNDIIHHYKDYLFIQEHI